MATTPDLGIPLISGQQAQPEVTHNEALAMLQAIAGGVISVGLDTPPGSPTEGDGYVVGTSPTGEWAGRANAVALFIQGEWRFLPDRDSNGTIITMGARQEGLRVYSRADQALYVWDDNASPAVFAWRELVLQSVPAQDYGELNVSGNTTAIAMTAATDSTLYTNGDYTQITGIWDATPHGELNGVSQQTNTITIGADGVYKIEMWGAVTASNANVNVAVKFAVNGNIGLTRRPRNRIGNSGDVKNLSAHGLVQLSAGDVISLWHVADTTTNITWEDLVFSVNELQRL